MNRAYLIYQAEKFLDKSGIAYATPGEIGAIEDTRIEIIFMKPEALDPNVVIDPPDVRVWVNKKTGKVKLIDQM